MAEMNLNEWMSTIWNKNYPIGTEVRLLNDSGEIEITKTRSIAWPIPSGQVLVKVVGKSGGYALSRILPNDIN